MASATPKKKGKSFTNTLREAKSSSKRERSPSSSDSSVPTPTPTPDTAATATATAEARKDRHIQNIRNIIEANNGWAKVKRVEDLNPYISKLQQYANDTPFHINAPIGAKGKQECPSTNGKIWGAHRKPDPDLDKKLGQQWSIQRKDYQGKNTPLFCYPDGVFDGETFATKEDNPAENLDLFAYTSPGDVTESLHTLVDLILPNNAITDTDKQRALITNSIIVSQKSSKVQKAYNNGLEQLANILSTCEYFAGKPRQARESSTKRKAKEWLKPVHDIAIVNVGLDSDADKAARACTQVYGKLDKKLGIQACVPETTFQLVLSDDTLLSKMDKDKVINFLVKYAKDIVRIQESAMDENWEDAFYNLTKEQKEQRLVRVISK